MDDAKLRAILQALVSEVEDLRASQAVAIANLRNLTKGTASDVKNAMQTAKGLHANRFDQLRKAIDELT